MNVPGTVNFITQSGFNLLTSDDVVAHNTYSHLNIVHHWALRAAVIPNTICNFRTRAKWKSHLSPLLCNISANVSSTQRTIATTRWGELYAAGLRILTLEHAVSAQSISTAVESGIHYQVDDFLTSLLQRAVQSPTQLVQFFELAAECDDEESLEFYLYFIGAVFRSQRQARARTCQRALELDLDSPTEAKKHSWAALTGPIERADISFRLPELEVDPTPDTVALWPAPERLRFGIKAMRDAFVLAGMLERTVWSDGFGAFSDQVWHHELVELNPVFHLFLQFHRLFLIDAAETAKSDFLAKKDQCLCPPGVGGH